MTPVAVDSSLLATVAYEGGQKMLQLEFRTGAIYRYFDVAAAVHQGLLAADSKGSYFNCEIRDKYPYVLVRSAGDKYRGSSVLYKSRKLNK